MVDLRLQDACQGTDVGMDLIQEQIDTGGGPFRVGANVVLVGPLQALPDLRRGITGKPLHIPERKAAADEQIEQNGASNDKDELGAE
jgi:hypothetical protein